MEEKRYTIIGTAGHIDHRKTWLVKALTGTDTDRLAEEKRRGITIENGFAFLKFPDGREAGIIDVPGHEKFIKNMLAGAGGIDIAMVVIAVDEGVMPQTREHLAILSLLGIQQGVIVLTKGDLEWKKAFIVKSVEAHRDVVPIHFEGRNSNFFYNLANLCKALGIKFNIPMLYLADEMLKNRHKTFTITIGKPIPWQTFDKSRTPAQWAQYVKEIVYKL